MKRTLFFLFLFVNIAFLSAQTNVDSLIHVLETKKLQTDEMLDLYIEISKFYINYDGAKSIKYAKEGLLLAEREKDKKQCSRLYKQLGITYYTNFYTREGFDTADIYLNKALVLAKELNDKKLEIAITSNLGSLYGIQEEYTTSLDYFVKALSLDDSRNEQTVGILCNIATIHRNLRNFKKALETYSKALEYTEQMDVENLRMSVLHAVGSVYADINEPEIAIEYLKKSLELSRKLQNKMYLTVTSLALAQAHSYNDDHEQALKHANEGLAFAEEFNSEAEILVAWCTLMEVNLELENYKEAEELALKVWAVDSTSMKMAAHVAYALSSIYIHLGNKSEAMRFLYEYQQILITNSEKSLHDSLADMEVKYETEKKELRIATLEKEKQLYLWMGITGAVVLLMAFGILFYRHRLNIQKRKNIEQQKELAEKQMILAKQQRKIAEQKNELAEQKIKQLEKEKQLVATQAVLDGEAAERTRLARDLHDGLGGLLSVVKLNLDKMEKYSVSDEPKEDCFCTAVSMLDQSISELRRVAHHMMPESLMRYGLKVSLEDYCRAIPAARFQYYGSEKRLDERLEEALYRCAFELVNNAIKYAQATAIHVQLMIDNGLVSLTVHDNGIGFDPEKVVSGFGLDNIRTRVSAYNGTMKIHSSPGNGSEISIEIERLKPFQDNR